MLMEFFIAFRPWISVIMLVTFIGLFIWIWGIKKGKDFDEAANLPFAEEEQEPKDGVEPSHDRENKR